MITRIWAVAGVLILVAAAGERSAALLIAALVALGVATVTHSQKGNA